MGQAVVTRVQAEQMWGKVEVYKFWLCGLPCPRDYFQSREERQEHSVPEHQSSQSSPSTSLRASTTAHLCCFLNEDVTHRKTVQRSRRQEQE